jgi:hypothetical protein
MNVELAEAFLMEEQDATETPGVAGESWGDDVGAEGLKSPER